MSIKRRMLCHVSITSMFVYIPHENNDDTHEMIPRRAGMQL